MTGEKKTSGKMAKTAILMVIITLSAKVLGMLRDILLAYFYGTSFEAVAYDTASRLPLILFDFVIGGVITATFIPIFNELIVKKGKKEALSFASGYVTVILIITLLLSVLGIVFSDELVAFLAPDLANETAELASALSKIMFPMIIFCGLAFSFVGLLQSFGSFLLPAVISLVSNLIIVAYLLVFNKNFGIYGLSAALLIGWGAQALIQLPSALKQGFRFSIKSDLFSPYIKRAFLMALPILVSSWVQPFCNLINTRFASSIDGGISAMGYANRLYLIIVGVFTFVATNLLFPYFAKAHSGGDKVEENRLTKSSIKTLMLIILPITFGIFVLSEPMISVIYLRGEFNADDVKMTAEALRFFAVGMPFYAINEIATKKFFAEQKTLTPMLCALVSIVVNVVAVSVLAEKMGIAGIALSSSVAVAVNAALNLLMRWFKGDRMIERSELVDIIKMLVAAVLMGLAAYFLMKALSGLLGLILIVVICAVLYFVLCFAFGEEMVKGAAGGFFERRKRI